MSAKDICKFISMENQRDNLRFYHFVYEASYWRLHQPFVREDYYLHLAFKGNATLTVAGRTYPLTPGTLFFTFPGQLYSISGDRSFTYMYITFNGSEAATLLNKFHVTPEAQVYPGMNHLLEFWMASLRRLTDYNAATLTESILLHTLSYLNTPVESPDKDSNRFEKILHYIHTHYENPDLSIAKVADMFFYNKKYLSALFIKNTNVRFSEYLNNLRIQQAELLMRRGLPVTETSAKCGFTHPSYFSKVFKNTKGCSPQEYMKQHTVTHQDP